MIPQSPRDFQGEKFPVRRLRRNPRVDSRAALITSYAVLIWISFFGGYKFFENL